jgi:hypothetical protein
MASDFGCGDARRAAASLTSCRPLRHPTSRTEHSHQPQMELYIAYIALAEGDMVTSSIVDDYPLHSKLDLPKY